MVRSIGGIALAAHSVTLESEDQQFADRIAALLENGRFTPPSLSELRQTTGIAPSKILEMLHILKEQGLAVEIQTGLWYHKYWITELSGILNAFFQNNQELTVAEFKKITNTTRKSAIPLLEYCDSSGLTFRVGDVREAG